MSLKWTSEICPPAARLPHSSGFPPERDNFENMAVAKEGVEITIPEMTSRSTKEENMVTIGSKVYDGCDDDDDLDS